MDPFTGTGTFMVRLLQSGIITPEDMICKYASELHATELMLLAYYVAPSWLILVHPWWVEDVVDEGVDVVG